MSRMMAAMAAAALTLTATAPAAAQSAAAPRMYAVKIAVRDAARTAQFYQLLGMQAGPRHNEWETELRWDDPARGSAVILVDARRSARFHVTRGGATLIFSSPDVYAALARLRSAGYAMRAETHVTGPAAIAMIQDPDGNWIELAGPAPAPK